MKRVVTTAVGLVTVMSVFGCGSSPTLAEASGGRAGAATAANSAPGAADVVDIECTPTGTNVSAKAVTARADGVHVRATDTSGASGVYLDYHHGPGLYLGGGDSVGDGTSVRVLSLPPGTTGFNCSSDLSRKGPPDKDDQPIAIKVLDPTHAWRTGALAAVGCADPRADSGRRPGQAGGPDGETHDLAAGAGRLYGSGTADLRAPTHGQTVDLRRRGSPNRRKLLGIRGCPVRPPRLGEAVRFTPFAIAAQRLSSEPASRRNENGRSVTIVSPALETACSA